MEKMGPHKMDSIISSNQFNVGDLVSHTKRNYFGIVIEVIESTMPHLGRETMYKIMWEHGEWMFELERQLHLEVKASSV